VIPRTHRYLANHAFATAAPSSWNSLPEEEEKKKFYFAEQIKITKQSTIKQ